MSGRHLPNTLTMLRLAAVPWLAWLLQERHWKSAAALVIAAGATDALDGFLARRFGWQSWLGSWLDPIADKVLVAACYIGLASIHRLFLPLAVVVLLRDGVIVVGAWAYRALIGPLQAHPTWLGKIASPLQLAFVVVALVCLAQEALPAAALGYGMLFVGLVTLASGFEYVWEWSRRARREWPNRNPK